MIRTISILALFLFLGDVVWSQQYTLDQCIANAKTYYPLAKAKDEVSAASDAKLKTLQAQYYPQFDLTGQMTWQNDIPHTVTQNIPFEIPTGSKDQYKGYVDVKQIIYDGGAISASKEAEKMRGEVDRQNIEVELRQAENGVIQAYFLILSIDKQLAQTEQNRIDLQARLTEAQSKVKSGMMLQSSADMFEVELLRTEQRHIALTQSRAASLAILAEYTGMAVSDQTVLELPADIAPSTEPLRPELAMLEAQSLQIEASKKLSVSTRIPKLSAFSQIGYGNPGFNMLYDHFEPFFMVGARLNWTPWDWQKSKNDRVALTHQQTVLTQRQQTVMTQIKVQQIDYASRITNLEQALTIDEKMVALRQNITKTALSQLNAGTITSADYISRLQEETVAKLGLDLHKVELAKAKAELRFVMGK
jgi:outer membrane protein TolC